MTMSIPRAWDVGRDEDDPMVHAYCTVSRPMGCTLHARATVARSRLTNVKQLMGKKSYSMYVRAIDATAVHSAFREIPVSEATT